MKPSLTLTGRVVGVHEASQWSDRKRRITIELADGVRVSFPAEQLFHLNETLKITVEATVANYGSEVLRTIPVSENLD